MPSLHVSLLIRFAQDLLEQGHPSSRVFLSTKGSVRLRHLDEGLNQVETIGSGWQRCGKLITSTSAV